MLRPGRFRWTRWTALSLTALGAGFFALSCSTAREAAAPVSMEAKLARGKAITYFAGCNDCHTPGTFYGQPDTTRILAGSELGWEGPWGVAFPRNLTPDVETGIGSWSEQDIVTAVREGRRPDGTPLAIAMPWVNFAHLSDEDAYALAAYLKSIPPVKHAMPAAIPPGQPPSGTRVTFPAPPAWDAQHMAPAAAH